MITLGGALANQSRKISIPTCRTPQQLDLLRVCLWISGFPKTYTDGLSVETFDGLENLFRYYLSDAEYRKFSSEFLKQKKRFHGQPRL